MPLLALFLSVLSLQSYAGEPAVLPAPQLLRLESTLTQKLEERKQGTLPPDQYRQFAAAFRVELDKALSQSPDSPVNRGRHAMILARLDESGPAQAVAALDRALAESPDDALLLNAKGTIQLQQGDYAGALASAEAVLKKNQERGEAPNPDAVAIRQFSKGRVVGSGGAASRGSPPIDSAPTQSTDPSGRQPIQFTQRAPRTRLDVPLESSAERTADESVITRGKAALIRGKDGVANWMDKAVLFVGRKMGLQPDEEADMLIASQKGGRVGAGIVGVSATVGAAVLCSPAIETGAGYGACVVAGGAVGTAGGYVAGSFGGGFASVAWSRSKVMLGQLSVYPEKKPEEEN